MPLHPTREFQSWKISWRIREHLFPHLSKSVPGCNTAGASPCGLVRVDWGQEGGQGLADTAFPALLSPHSSFPSPHVCINNVCIEIHYSAVLDRKRLLRATANIYGSGGATTEKKWKGREANIECMQMQLQLVLPAWVMFPDPSQIPNSMHNQFTQILGSTELWMCLEILPLEASGWVKSGLIGIWGTNPISVDPKPSGSDCILWLI